ncbi:RNA ligase family protein (plasmid) [Streptomyces xanthophaeus]|uniref:ATP-dependent DNA ligase n=1 Tax=Streptomyces xanthophaeus TaxID=67385 RepID=UPI003990355B
MTLFPPVEPMLAQAAEAIPPVRPPAAVAYEQKFDGHRMLVFTPAGPGGRVLLQTRRGALVQAAFPDLVAAAEQLPHGLVLDGEVLVWDPESGGLSFEALQRRAAARARTAPALAARLPAFFVAFDVLQVDGTELLTLPHRERRRRLEALFAARELAAPWTLCPMTTDVATAREWLEDWTDVPGLEGVVVKSMAQPCRTSARGWTKVRRRDTTEGIFPVKSLCSARGGRCGGGTALGTDRRNAVSDPTVMGPLTEFGLLGNCPRGLWPADSAASEGSDDPSGVAPLVGVEGAAGVDDLGAGWRVSSASSTAAIGSST